MEVGSVKQLPPSVVTRLTPAEVGRPAVKEADERSPEDMQASLRPEAEPREASRSQVEGAVSAIQEFVQSGVPWTFAWMIRPAAWWFRSPTGSRGMSFVRCLLKKR